MLKLLNLGCGSRFCTNQCWTNVDFRTFSNQVISHNILRGLPFSDETFDAVYHSHLLEHFTKEDGRRLIGECFRVLKADGVLRVVVPDLEQMVRIYLMALEKANSGSKEWAAKHEWILLEMYDQTVRNYSGGEMARYLRRPDLPHKEFIISRIGSVGRDIIEAVDPPVGEVRAVDSPLPLERWAGKISRLPKYFRQLLLSSVLNDHEKKALAIGLFRLSGEVHQWMYDVYSLSILLRYAGFRHIQQCSATESTIPHWKGYSLDTDPDGFEHAPSSLYLEGAKPK